jgi:hypothetical protein
MTFKTCDLKRAIKAVTDCGLTVYGCTITGNQIDILTQPVEKPQTKDPLADWEKRRGKAA